MFVVICDGLYVTDEFEGTFEECLQFVEENSEGYKLCGVLKIVEA